MPSINDSYLMNTNTVTVHLLYYTMTLPCFQLESLSKSFVLEDSISPRTFRSTLLALHSYSKHDTRLFQMLTLYSFKCKSFMFHVNCLGTKHALRHASFQASAAKQIRYALFWGSVRWWFVTIVSGQPMSLADGTDSLSWNVGIK